MRVDSIGITKETLAACFTRNVPFSVKYKGGISVSVRPSEHGWSVDREKFGDRVSSFSARAEGSRYFFESDSPLVKEVLEGMAAGAHLFTRLGNVVELAKHLVSVLDVYGGPVKRIISLDVQE